MSMSYEEYQMEQALDDLHSEAKMNRAKKEQCIFLFVEGHSEEIAIPILFDGLIDLADLGVTIANYNGIGNLKASLKLLSSTLSHNRPVIVTYDNDFDSKRKIEEIRKLEIDKDLFYFFSIPQEKVVKYSNGKIGGSFEESFLVQDFIKYSFSKGIIPDELLDKKEAFIIDFNSKKPWIEQIKKFCALNNYKSWDLKKTLLAEELAVSVKDVPLTFQKLAKLIKNVRRKYPVIYPDDVVLPKIPGLTC